MTTTYEAPAWLGDVVELESIAAKVSEWHEPTRRMVDAFRRGLDRVGLVLVPDMARDMARAQELARCRRRALVLARGRDVLAVEAARLLRHELAASHDFTAGLIARALDGDAEALDDWRDMLDHDDPQLAELAREVLDLAARIALHVQAVAVHGDRVARLAADVVAGRDEIRPAEVVDRPPPRITLAGSVEPTAPPMTRTCAPAANGQRDATRTRGGMSPP